MTTRYGPNRKTVGIYSTINLNAWVIPEFATHHRGIRDGREKRSRAISSHQGNPRISNPALVIYWRRFDIDSSFPANLGTPGPAPGSIRRRNETGITSRCSESWIARARR